MQPPAGGKQQLTIPQAVRLAHQHHAQGRNQQAVQLIRQILSNVPGHPSALHLLGVIEHGAGKTEDAIRDINSAIASNPNVALFHANIGEMYRITKNLDKAIEHGRKAVALDPKMASAQSNLGIALYDKDELEAAEACHEKALALNPSCLPSLNNMGSIRQKQEDRDGAIGFYKKVIALNPNYVETLSNLGAVYCIKEAYKDALGVLSRATQLDPRHAEAQCNLGNVYAGLNQPDKALLAFRQAITIRPEYPEALVGIARVQQDAGDLDAARRAVELAIDAEPDKAEYQSLLGSIHNEAGDTGKARDCFEKALTMDEEQVSAYLGLGNLEMEQGHLDEAQRLYEKGLALDPENTAAHVAMTHLVKMTADHPSLLALEQEASKVDELHSSRAMSLHFALGKAYDDIKDADKAFPHFLAGNRIKRSKVEYSADKHSQSIENIKQIFNSDMLQSLAGAGCPSRRPIFIMGMPRSGTTLTESIISSHPDVFGAGELRDLMQIARNPNGNSSEPGFPNSMKGITGEQLYQLGEKYVAALDKYDTDAPRVTDKMPANFLALGFAHLAMPNARIIHIRRNPVDTCLSNYSKLFNRGQFHSYELEELGRFYLDYVNIMDHWREVLPEGSFYEVQYEDLVNDAPEQARALIDYCDLEWHDACLDFHKSRRRVKTASVTQVRKPVYQSSVERWRPYEKHLQPLLEVLAPVLDR
jgi:tetratricopeptide (TPR) repeat protein